MDLRQDTAKGVIVLDVAGRIDNTTAPALQERLISVMGEPQAKVLVDFTKLDYISSAGFRILLFAAKQANQTGCRFVLCGVTGRTRQVFDAAGFLELFSIAATRDEGITTAAG